MISRDHGNWVLYTLHIRIIRLLTIFGSQPSAFFLCCDAFPNGSLGGPLAQLSDIGSCEVLGKLGTELKGDIRCDWTLSQVGFKDVDSGTLVWQWDVNELIETTRSDEGLIEDIWSICGSDEEQILLLSGTVHLGQKLVKHSITSATATSS